MRGRCVLMTGYVIRTVAFGVGVGLSSLASSMVGSDLTWAEVVLAVSLGWGGALSYAGIGAASTKLEPNVGRTRHRHGGRKR